MNYRIFSAGTLLLISSFIAAQPHDAITTYIAYSSLRAPKDFISLTKGGLPFIEVINQTVPFICAEDSSQELKTIANLIQTGRKSVSRTILKNALIQATQIIIKNIEKLSPATAQTLLEKLNICLKYFGIEPITPTNTVTPPVIENTAIITVLAPAVIPV